MEDSRKEIAGYLVMEEVAIAEKLAVTDEELEFELSKIAEHLDCEITDFLDGTTKKTPLYLSEDLSEVFVKLTPANKKILLDISETLLKNQG